jgi:hypothetical protein
MRGKGGYVMRYIVAGSGCSSIRGRSIGRGRGAVGRASVISRGGKGRIRRVGRSGCSVGLG